MKRIIIILFIVFVLVITIGLIYGYTYFNPSRYINPSQKTIKYDTGELRYENMNFNLGCNLLKSRICIRHFVNYSFFSPNVNFPIKVVIESNLNKIIESSIFALFKSRNDIKQFGKGDWDKQYYYIGEKKDGSYATIWSSDTKILLIESFGQVENNDFFEDLLTEYLEKYPSDVARD